MRTLIALLLIAAGPAFAGAAQPVTGDQLSYRSKLDKAFLDAGITIHVEAIGDPKGSRIPKDAKMPVLMIWNEYLTRPDVYQIETKLNVIDDARKSNFGTVIFWGASGGAGWYQFDVSKPGQVCHRDLCF